MVGQRPAQYSACVKVHDNGEVEPFRAASDVGNIADPDLIDFFYFVWREFVFE